MPVFKCIIFYQNSPKFKLFFKKNARFSSAGGSVPRPQTQPPLRISGYALDKLCTVFNNIRVYSFCFEQFFLDRSVANLMILFIDVCLMLNCFLFEKFYLHYALRDFDSICDIALSYLFAKVKIANKFLMSLLKPPPPLKNLAYATVQACRIVTTTSLVIVT